MIYDCVSNDKNMIFCNVKLAYVSVNGTPLSSYFYDFSQFSFLPVIDDVMEKFSLLPETIVIRLDILLFK